MRRRQLVVVATLVAGLVLVVLVAQLAALRGQDTDLYPRWYGLRQLMVHGRDPYGDDVSREVATQIWFFDGHVSAPESGPATPLERIYGFLYPLPGMLLLAPLALLPYPLAYGVWVLAMLAGLPVAAGLMMAVGEGRGGHSPHAAQARWRVLAAAVLALVFLPTWADVMLGQLAPAAAWLVALAVWLRRPAAAGAALAAAVAVKPHVLTLLSPCWLSWHALRALRGDVASRQFLAGAALSAAGLAGAAFLLLPSWLMEFVHAARDYVGVRPGEVAVLVVARTLGLGDLAPAAAAAAGGAALAWALAAWWSALGNRHLERHAIWRTLAVSALVVPPAWETNAVLLLLPLAAAVGALPSRRAAGVVVAVSAAITVFLLPPYFTLGWQRGTLVIAAYLGLLWAVQARQAWSSRREIGAGATLTAQYVPAAGVAAPSGPG